MMEYKIGIDVQTMEDELKSMQNAFEIFEPYSKEFITYQKEKLEDFNSDFIEEYKDVLRVLMDDSGESLLRNIKEYHKNASEAIEVIKETDEKLGE